MAKLYWRYGVMGSGKSAAISIVAYNYRSVGKTPYVIKPAMDTKSTDKLVSRIDALSLVADHLSQPDHNLYTLIEKLEEKPDAIIVDEAQWLTVEQVNQLFLIAVQLDIPVMTYGLRTDYNGELWKSAGRLFALAHDISELKMVCHCGSKAMFTHLKVDTSNSHPDEDGAPILVGADEYYDALCAEHYLKDTTYENSLTATQNEMLMEQSAQYFGYRLTHQAGDFGYSWRHFDWTLSTTDGIDEAFEKLQAKMAEDDYDLQLTMTPPVRLIFMCG